MIFKSSVALLEMKHFDSLLYMHMRGVIQYYIFQVVKNTANQNARNLFYIACVYHVIFHEKVFVVRVATILHHWKTEKIVTGETFQSTKIVRCDFVDHLLNLILGRLEAEV